MNETVGIYIKQIRYDKFISFLNCHEVGDCETIWGRSIDSGA